MNFNKNLYNTCLKNYRPYFQNALFSTAISEGPLSGMRILDFTRILAGPFATMILGDLGAEVIKIEAPNTGDDTRTWGPPFIGKESCYFVSVNRNKKSVVVDLKHPSGLEIVRKLASKSDILLENFTPGTMDRLGLGYQSLKQICPRLIYGSVTGYGQTGPYMKRGGYDVLAGSMAGLLGVTGPEDGEPCKPGVAMTDLATGLYMHGAVMAALLQRIKTNEGQFIDCNLLSSQMSCMTHIASNWLNAGVEGKRRGTAHESVVPYQAFKTKDGYITVGGGNDKLFKSLCEYIGLKELSEDKRYKSNALRVQNRNSLIQSLTESFGQKTNSEWLNVFEGAKFPYGPINTMEEALNDPQLIHNDMIQSVQHPTAGEVKVIGPAVKYNEIVNKIRSPPPLLGQHTAEVLSEVVGLSIQEIEQLKKDGTVQALS